jgi:hypothetical protein
MVASCNSDIVRTLSGVQSFLDKCQDKKMHFMPPLTTENGNQPLGKASIGFGEISGRPE